MTPHETAVKIAEAVMDAIEKRRGIIKDDLIEAARGVIAGNLSGPASGYPMAHYGLDLAKGEDKTAGWIRDSNGMRWAAIPPTSSRLDGRKEK